MPEDVKKPAKAKTAEANAPVVKKETSASSKKSDNKTLKIVLIVVGVLVGLGVLATIASILFVGVLFDKATDGIDIDDESGTVSFQSEDGKVTTNVGENVKLADGFPTDIPIFEPSTLVASTKVSDSQFSSVAKTASSVADVTNYYKTQMAAQGWTTQFDSTSADSTLITFQKGNRTSSVVITTSPDESSNEKTGFVVSVSDQM
jgi:hypothetical protein